MGSGLGAAAFAPVDDLPPLHLGTDSMNPQVAYARQARRLYVANITLEANDENIAAFFNQQMREKGFAIDKKDGPIEVQAPDPVVSIQINYDKAYVFVEVSDIHKTLPNLLQ